MPNLLTLACVKTEISTFKQTNRHILTGIVVVLININILHICEVPRLIPPVISTSFLQACRGVFEPPNETGYSNSESNTVDVACGERNTDVLQCISNHTDMSPPLDVEKCKPI